MKKMIPAAVTFLVLAAVLLTCCYEFNNPLDPNGDNYQGYGIYNDEDVPVNAVFELKGASPSGGMTIADTTPLLEWNDVKGLTSWDIRFSTNKDLKDAVIIPCSQSSYQVPDEDALSFEQQYFWQVRGLTSDGRVTAWTKAMSFTVRSSVSWSGTLLENGIYEKNFNNPILSLGESGDFDDTWVWSPCIIKTDESDYRMYYQGNVKSEGSAKSSGVGLAVSSDGLNWVKSNPNPVFTMTGSYNGPVLSCVIKDNEGYKLYYRKHSSSYGYGIALATSTDGISWTEYPGSETEGAVLRGYGSGGYDNSVMYATVIYNNSDDTYEMWYNQRLSETHYRIEYAYSSDGYTWTKYQHNPVITETAGTWTERHLYPGTIYKTDGKYWLYCGATSKVGLFSSPDGINWTPVDNNPLLLPGAAGAFDETAVFLQSILVTDSRFLLYGYGVNSASERRIGYAELKLE